MGQDSSTYNQKYIKEMQYIVIPKLNQIRLFQTHKYLYSVSQYLVLKPPEEVKILMLKTFWKMLT